MSNWQYILIMGATTYILRLLPFTLIRKPIKNPFIRSFLYYVPYVTLSVMTFPAILYVTENIWAGAIALLVGIFLAWKDKSMFTVALVCCAIVYVMEMIV